MKRILTALAGIPVLFLIIKELPPIVFALLVGAASALAALELYAIAGRRGLHPHRILGAALAAATAYSFFDFGAGPLDTLCVAALAVPLASLARARAGGASLEGELESIAATLMGVVPIGLLMGYCLALLGDGGEQGRDLTLLLFWVVWLADAGALALGSLAGRRRLMPGISPGKTWAGAAGGLAAALAAAAAAKLWFFTRLAWRDAAALGLLMGTAGMLGDLTESLIKRTAAVKDSGGLFPGHGGVLDRTDSLLFAAPVLFYYHKFFMS
ncbi:MAG TPA: phosphatidate cytidylyltransferase [Candidatus Polarisedimenticolia bacterium]|nr:phosphatidate cytidylyltransferase [Candidatus Polarisedimenticolia bacterium]